MDPVYYNELRDQLHITEVSPLVDEYQVGAQPWSVFFTLSQSVAFHFWMAASLRSNARRSGFWGLQSRACRVRAEMAHYTTRIELHVAEEEDSSEFYETVHQAMEDLGFLG